MTITLHDNLDGTVHYQAEFDTQHGPAYYSGTAETKSQAHYYLQQVAKVHGYTLLLAHNVLK
jgi:hypothetical protein